MSAYTEPNVSKTVDVIKTDTPSINGGTPTDTKSADVLTAECYNVGTDKFTVRVGFKLTGTSIAPAEQAVVKLLVNGNPVSEKRYDSAGVYCDLVGKAEASDEIAIEFSATAGPTQPMFLNDNRFIILAGQDSVPCDC